MHGTVLVYGNDEVLVMTRCLILGKAGYEVFTAQTFGHAMLVLMNHQIDVCVLCQSLKVEVRYLGNGKRDPTGYRMCGPGLRGERSCDRRGGSYQRAGGTFHTPQCSKKGAHTKSG